MKTQEANQTDYMNISDAASELGMSTSFIRNRINDGSIRAIKFGRRIKIRKTDWARYKKLVEMESAS